MATSGHFRAQKYAGLHVEVDGLLVDLVERLPAEPHGLHLLVAFVEEDDVGAPEDTVARWL